MDIWQNTADENLASLFHDDPAAGDLQSLWLSWQAPESPAVNPALGSQSAARIITTQAPIMQGNSTELSSGSGSAVQSSITHSASSAPPSITLPCNSSSSPLSSGHSAPLPRLQTAPNGGWQSLLSHVLDDPPPAALAVVPASKRGRKPKPTPGGATKPVRDTKRENTVLIRQLEQDLTNKLNLMKELKDKNCELKRQERLLEMSVNISEHSLTRLADPQLDTNIKVVLQSLRGAYNRSAAEKLLEKIARIENPKDLTFEVFCSCWNALVMEMCDCLMSDSTATTAEAKQEAERHLELITRKTIDFAMAVCVHDYSMIMHARHRNLVTGEYMPELNIDFWIAMVDKMDLSEDQIKDMAYAYDLFANDMEQNIKDRAAIKEELAAAVAQQEELRVLHQGVCDPHASNVRTKVTQASQRLNSNILRFDTLRKMTTFLALRIMTTRQAARMCMHASPTFPSPLQITVAAYHKAVAQGLVSPRPDFVMDY